MRSIFPPPPPGCFYYFLDSYFAIPLLLFLPLFHSLSILSSIYHFIPLFVMPLFRLTHPSLRYLLPLLFITLIPFLLLFLSISCSPALPVSLSSFTLIWFLIPSLPPLFFFLLIPFCLLLPPSLMLLFPLPLSFGSLFLFPLINVFFYLFLSVPFSCFIYVPFSSFSVIWYLIYLLLSPPLLYSFLPIFFLLFSSVYLSSFPAFFIFSFFFLLLL